MSLSTSTSEYSLAWNERLLRSRMLYAQNMKRECLAKRHFVLPSGCWAACRKSRAMWALKLSFLSPGSNGPPTPYGNRVGKALAHRYAFSLVRLCVRIYSERSGHDTGLSADPSCLRSMTWIEDCACGGNAILVSTTPSNSSSVLRFCARGCLVGFVRWHFGSFLFFLVFLLLREGCLLGIFFCLFLFLGLCLFV